MCSRFILSTLFFSLVLGPQVMFLHAQGLDEISVSTPLNNKTVMTNESESLVTAPENPNSVSPTMSTAYPTIDFITATDSTTAPSQLTSTPETQPVMTHTEAKSTFPELPQVLTTTVTLDVTTMQPTDPRTTTERPDTTVDDGVTTTAEDPKTSSPVPTSALRTAETTALEATTILPTHTVEIRETTHSSMATDPIPILTTEHEEEDYYTEVGTEISTEVGTEISTNTTTVTDDTLANVPETKHIEISKTGAENSEQDTSSKWLLITIVVVVAICMLMGFCIIIFVKHRKKSGQQNFGHMNGRNQRSKKKKGENDAWAGPVNLEGGQNADCEDPAEAGQGDDRNPDGTDAVLSTFAALETNGGVGRPGSMEAQKWEEQEPLLFIDEDLKGEGKDKQKEGAEKAKGQKGEEEDASKNIETKEPELNGGETFCLTTAV